MAAQGAGSIHARIDPASLRKLLIDAKEFDAALARQLRMRLRAAGADAVADMKRTLRAPTPAGRGMHSGSAREAIAETARVAVLAGKRRQGVRIVTSGSQLTAKHKAMLKAYNLGTWRHPARGGGRIIEQSGRPYFGAVIGRRKLAMRIAVEKAMLDARRAIH